MIRSIGRISASAAFCGVLAVGAVAAMPAPEAHAAGNPVATITSTGAGGVSVAEGYGFPDPVDGSTAPPQASVELVNGDDAKFSMGTAGGHVYIDSITVSEGGVTKVIGQCRPDDPDADFMNYSLSEDIELGSITVSLNASALKYYEGNDTFGRNCLQRVDFGMSHIDESITVSVVFREMDSYDLTFHSNFGDGDDEIVKSVELYAGDAMGEAPEAPAREGYEFVGWAETPDAEKAVEWDPEAAMGRADADYYAVWEKVGDTGTGDDGVEDQIPPAEETENTGTGDDEGDGGEPAAAGDDEEKQVLPKTGDAAPVLAVAAALVASSGAAVAMAGISRSRGGR